MKLLPKMVLDARSILGCAVLAFPLAWFWRQVAVPLILRVPRTSAEALELLNTVSGVRPESMHEAMDVFRGYFLYVARNVNPWVLALLLVVILVALEFCCAAPPRKPPPFDPQRLLRKRSGGGNGGDGGRGSSSSRTGQQRDGERGEGEGNGTGGDGHEHATDTGDASLDEELAGINRELDDIMSQLGALEGAAAAAAASEGSDASDGSAISGAAGKNAGCSDGSSATGSSGAGLRARRSQGRKQKEKKDIAAATVKQATI